MKTITLAFLISIISLNMAQGQSILNLWTQEARPVTEQDIAEAKKNVTEPELWIYKAQQPTGKAILICPGGGYSHLAMEHEGIDIAHWLNEQGITALVLKYRMPQGVDYVPLRDAYQAMQYIKEHAEELGVDKEQVGVLGFSAGGHLAASVSNLINTTDETLRPKFSVLFYPVISMGENTHAGSRLNLLGEKPSEKQIEKYSAHLQVTDNTPPTILLLSDDDKAVVPQNSTNYYNALKAHSITASVHIFPTGGHGWGARKTFLYHNEAFEALKNWLENIA